MQTKYLHQRFFRQVRRICQTKLSKEAQERWDAVKRFELARREGLSGQQAARVVGKPRSTLFRWRHALLRQGPRGLQGKSCKPKRVRPKEWSPQALEKLKRLRREFPAWGKKKLTPLLRKAGHEVSESTVGRMLTYLVGRRLIQPVHLLIGQRRWKRSAAKRQWAVRLRRGKRLKGDHPGQAVQLDTLTVRLLDGGLRKHFNAVCTVSKWNVAGVYERSTARTAADFLHRLETEMPFPIRGLQIDGGSEFMAEFEQACQRKGLPLYVLAPNSPELNGGVERLNRTWRDEFYDLYDDLPSRLDELRPEVYEQQMVINHIRPHEGLDLITPAEYLAKEYPDYAPQSHMY